jgi:hypothetical protein
MLAGCAWTSAPSAADRRAELDRWRDEADAACRTANAAIAGRGRPASLIDLDRLTVRAIADVREASTAIERLPAPEGSERRVAAFVRSLRRLEPLMGRLGSTTEDLQAGRLEAFAPRLQSGLAAVGDEAKRLGLRHCAAHDEHVLVTDAIRAPVFAEQLATLHRRILGRVKAIGEPAATRWAASRDLDELSEVVAFADRGLSRLKPPAWAEAEAERYVDALRDLGSALDIASAELAGAIFTPAEASAAQARVDRAIGVERARFKRLFREIGAVPVLPDDDGGEEVSPAGDETQEA